MAVGSPKKSRKMGVFDLRNERVYDRVTAL